MFLVRFCRKIWRLGLVLLWMPVIGGVAVFACIGGWRGVAKVSCYTQIWGAVLCRILHIGIHCHDYREIRGGLLVSNHQTYLDVLIHAALFPIRFAPKKEVRHWFLLGPYLAISRPVWVDRSNRAGASQCADEFAATMEHGVNLVVYPEGTTGNGGPQLLPFKSTVFESAVRSGRAVHPVLTCYRRPESGVPVAWYGDMTLLAHVWNVLGEKAIHADVYFLPEISPSGHTRKELTRLTRDAMQVKLDEVYAKTL